LRQAVEEFIRKESKINDFSIVVEDEVIDVNAQID